MSSNVTIEIDVDVYIRMLDNRRNGDWGVREIPDGLWDWFCGEIRDGYITPSDTDPVSVVDNFGNNGVFGALENYSLLEAVEETALARYASENGGESLDDEGMAEYIRDNAAEVMESLDGDTRGAFECWYTDDRSDYGIGVCLSI